MEKTTEKLKQELSESILQSEKIFNELISKLKNSETQKTSPEERFLELIKGTVIKHDFEKYPDQLFWYQGNEIVMEQDSKNDCLWVDYDKIWSFFETEFGLNFNEIRDLIKGMVEQRFNMKVGTPKKTAGLIKEGWNNVSI